AGMVDDSKEWNLGVPCQVFVSDNVIIEEVFQYNQRQRSANSKYYGGGVDHFYVGRNRPGACHCFIDNVLLDDIRSDSYPGFRPLFEQVVIHIVTKVVAPLDLH